MSKLRPSIVAAVTSTLLVAATVLATNDAGGTRSASHEAALFDGSGLKARQYVAAEPVPVTDERKVRSWGNGWEVDFTDVSDPRLRGTYRTTLNSDFHLGGGQMWTASSRVDNAGGSWFGAMTGYQDGDARFHHHGVLTGTGAYEGMTALIWLVDEGAVYEVHGIVFPGDPPPSPDPPAPPTE